MTLLLIVGCHGCERATPIAPTSAPSITVHAPDFELNAEEWARLVPLLRSVKRGDSPDQVLSRVGKPTYDQNAAGKGPDAPAFRIFSYYFVRYENNLVNTKHDRVVELFFDEQGHLKSVASNVEGVPEINFPGERVTH